MMNNGRPAIPQHQLGNFKCPSCGDEVFQPIKCVKFSFDRLAPERLQPQAVQMMQCLSCKGFLTLSDGKWVVVKEPGDEWKVD